ncbi:MAG: YeeE/YedE family protein [Burkholderiales bacterium]|nr:YeeE/YedE family protein [Burkholderiales bacterium]MBK9345495.1 YeeE/YedE family protein [Burkholderiales bacterium]
MSFSKFLAVLVSGALFGFGLALSTMVQPEVVLSFLRFQDWGLMLVMGGAVLVTLLTYQLVPRLCKRPLLGDHFAVRPAILDRDTVLGAAIFGVGWGICGVCPGPAIAGLGTGNAAMLVALGGIVLGAYLQGVLHADP